MQYISIAFLGFTVVSLALYWLVPQKARAYILLAASLFFYALNAKWLLLPILALTAVVYGCSVWIGKKDAAFAAAKTDMPREERKSAKQKLKKKKQGILLLECAAAFGMLIVFKYTGFLAGTLNAALSLFTKAAVPIPTLLLPLGISYYTLSVVSYAADVYYGKVQPEKNPLKLLTYATYFPHIVEGPIASYAPFSKQLDAPNALTFDRFLRAAERILVGLLKKMIIADRAGMAADVVFSHPGEYHFIAAAGGIVLYAVQLYFDFAGCIDLVRGVSELFGIELAENFRRPFFSRSVQEFWRRWHMTLGGWIRNYIFYPLSLTKWNTRLTTKAGTIKNAYFRSTLPMLLPLLFVWLFTGIWHGASWKYVLYGLYYYIILASGLLFEPVFALVCKKLHIRRESGAYHVFQILRTDLLVLAGLTLFRADTVRQAGRILLSVFQIGAIVPELAGLKDASTLSILDFALLLIGTAAFAVLSVCEEKKEFNLFDALEKRPAVRWLFVTAAILAVIALGVYGAGYTAKPFVYAQF